MPEIPGQSYGGALLTGFNEERPDPHLLKAVVRTPESRTVYG